MRSAGTEQFLKFGVQLLALGDEFLHASDLAVNFHAHHLLSYTLDIAFEGGCLQIRNSGVSPMLYGASKCASV
jgi:hypothetical protein